MKADTKYGWDQSIQKQNVLTGGIWNRLVITGWMLRSVIREQIKVLLYLHLANHHVWILLFLDFLFEFLCFWILRVIWQTSLSFGSGNTHTSKLVFRTALWIIIGITKLLWSYFRTHSYHDIRELSLDILFIWHFYILLGLCLGCGFFQFGGIYNPGWNLASTTRDNWPEEYSGSTIFTPNQWSKIWHQMWSRHVSICAYMSKLDLQWSNEPP
jgi:hypothetical protein